MQNPFSKNLIMAGIITITLPFGGAVPATPAVQPTNPVAVNSGAGSDTSFNWSGYQTTGGSYTGISATWSVPTVSSATSTEADATWVGIGGVASQDLIQAGTQAVINGSGAPTYNAWYEILPQNTTQVPLTVSPGDSITASLQETSPASGTMPAQWSVAIRDNTTGQSYQTTIAYNSSLSSAEWIEEMPSDGTNFVPLDNFGTISFAGASAIENGSSVSLTGANAKMITMVNRSGQVLASPSAIESDGESFSVSRTNAPTSVAINFRLGHGGLGRGWHRTGVGVEGFMPQPQSQPQPITTQPVTVSVSSSTGIGGFGGFGFSGAARSQIFRLIQQLQQIRNGMTVNSWRR